MRSAAATDAATRAATRAATDLATDGGRGVGLATGALILGGAGSVAALFVWPERWWLNLLVAGQFLLGLGLGAGFFVALLHVVGASWAVALRRVPEAITRLIVPGGIVTLAVVLLHPGTWPWVGAPAGAPRLWFREMWLDLRFFQLRSVIYVLLWVWLSAWLVRPSLQQDEDGRIEHTLVSRRRAAIYLVLFAVTLWLASTDWLMSLDPNWYSTIFAPYQFSSIFLAALAAVALAVVRLRERGPLQGVVTEEHLHDLGKLLFAFSTFWMYIWFSQLLLIWYANIPAETIYYAPRVLPWWFPLFLLNIAFSWAIPFLILLRRDMKRRPTVLAGLGVLLLIGHWLDLYLATSPRLLGERPALGIPELAPMLLTLGIALLVFDRSFRRGRPVPVRDPFLEESLHYHV